MSSKIIQKPQAIKKVVIVGRDAPAWLAASALTRAFGRSGLAVEVVELPSLLRSQDIYKTLPAMEAFHSLLGLEEYALMKASSGTYSLGQSFANFARNRQPFFHAYGSVGAPINRTAFLPFWIKARREGMKVDLEDFSLTAAAAKQGRFFVPGDELNGFATCEYAYHLKAVPYVELLKAQALKHGAKTQAGRVASAQRDNETGRIRHLILNDGRQIDGDLFIDASGVESVLLDGVMRSKYESWAHWFPGNRILTASGERLKSLPVYSQVRALQFSFLHLAPVQDSTHLQHVYFDEDMKDDEALEKAALISNLRLYPGAVVDKLKVGRHSESWIGNCIAIGDAACVLDPIDNAGLHTVQLGLAHLISLFPVDEAYDLERREYNTSLKSYFERIRDFQISHFKLNQILNEPYWNHFRDMSVPDTLSHKIEMFSARGIVPMYDNETFEIDSWQMVFAGHGLLPETYDPLVDLTPPEVAVPQFQRILGHIKEQVQDMSSHDAYLELYASKNFA